MCLLVDGQKRILFQRIGPSVVLGALINIDRQLARRNQHTSEICGFGDSPPGATLRTLPRSSTKPWTSTSYQTRIQNSILYSIIGTWKRSFIFLTRVVGICNWEHNSSTKYLLTSNSCALYKNQKSTSAGGFQQSHLTGHPSVGLHRVMWPLRHPSRTSFATWGLIWWAIHIRHPSHGTRIHHSFPPRLRSWYHIMEKSKNRARRKRIMTSQWIGYCNVSRFHLPYS